MKSTFISICIMFCSFVLFIVAISAIICFTVSPIFLAIYFNKWWIGLFTIVILAMLLTIAAE